MRDRGPLVGVAIGAGYFSGFHYDAWARLAAAGEAEIAAIFTRDGAAATAKAAEHGVAEGLPLAALSEAVARIRPDFVDLIVPPAAQLDLVRFFVERGIAIQCQKPLGRDYAEAQAIVAIAAAAGVPFMVHENWRWQPWYRAIGAMIGPGAPLGELFSLSSRMRMGDGWPADAYLARQPYFRDYPRLLLFETGVHYLDTFRFLGGDIRQVHARIQRRNPAIAGEDAAQIMVGFESGATGLFDGSRYNESEHPNPRKTFGTLRVDAAGGHVSFDEDGAIRVKRLGEAAEAHAYAWEDRGFAGDCVFATNAHFIRELRGAQAFESDGASYLKTLALVEACYRSAASGQVETVTA